MPSSTSRWKIPYLTIVERPSIHGISSQIATATDAALTLVQAAVDAARSVADVAKGRVDAHDSAPAGTIAMQSGGQTIPGDGAGIVLQLSRNVLTYQGMRAAGQATRMLAARPGLHLATMTVPFDAVTNAQGTRQAEMRVSANGNVGGGSRVGDRQVTDAGTSGRTLLFYSVPVRLELGNGVEVFAFQTQGVGAQVGVNASLSLIWLAP